MGGTFLQESVRMGIRCKSKFLLSSCGKREKIRRCFLSARFLIISVATFVSSTRDLPVRRLVKNATYFENAIVAVKDFDIVSLWLGTFRRRAALTARRLRRRPCCSIPRRELTIDGSRIMQRQLAHLYSVRSTTRRPRLWWLAVLDARS